MTNGSVELSITDEIDERVARLVLSEYAHECERLEGSINEDGYAAPFIGNLVKLIYEELWLEERVSLIDAAVHRKEDMLYGYANSEDFVVAAWRREVNDPSLQPDIEMDKVLRQVRQFLMENQMFFLDHHDALRNIPVKEVW